MPAPSSDAHLPALPSSSSRGVDLRAALEESNDRAMLVVRLQPGESVRAPPSALLYQTMGVSVQGDGLLVDFVNSGRGEEQVAFSPEYPSDFELVDLRERGGTLIVQRGALLCAHSSVAVTDEVSRAPSADAFLGGGGFSPQRLTGEGAVVLKGGGGFYADELLDGQTIKVTPAALLACESTVSFSTAPLSAQPPSPSLLTLTGPGVVWLQTIPPHRALLSSLAAGNAALVPFNAQQQSSAVGQPMMSSPFGFGGGGGGMLSGLGGALATGAAMGAGSELAHRALGGFGHSAPPPPAADPGTAAAPAAVAPDSLGAGGGDQGQDMGGMRSDLPPEDSGGGEGGWFGGLFGGDNDSGGDGGGDDGGDWGDEE